MYIYPRVTIAILLLNSSNFIQQSFVKYFLFLHIQQEAYSLLPLLKYIAPCCYKDMDDATITRTTM